MRKVIDSNALRSPALIGFLGASEKNCAVISDFCGVEAHRESPLTTVPESMSALCRFPRQVLILKTTNALCGLSGRLKGLQRRLIDEKQTDGFPKYCQHLKRAKMRVPGIQRQLLANGRAAAGIIQVIEESVPTVTEWIQHVAARYSSEERRIIRAGHGLTREVVDKLVESTMSTAKMLFANDPRVANLPSYDEALNHYTFRFSLCGQLLAARWGALGGALGSNVATIRNDLIDLQFVTCATYFDGLLSADRKAQLIYRQATAILSVMRGR